MTAPRTAFLVCALAVIVACVSTRPETAAPRPNVVFLLADDLGWRDPGFMGSDYHRTPQIDRLASAGLTFTQAYACAANCAPSRAALLSGQYAPRTGVYTVNSSARGQAADRRLVPVPNRTELAGEVVTLAETLRAAGYRTAAIGKWHLGEGPQTGPLGQGFDINVGGNAKGHPRSYHSPYRNPDLPDGPQGEYLTTRLTDEAIEFVRAADDRPFFLYLSYFAVHTPIQPRADHLAALEGREPGRRHHRARYAAMVEGLDHEVGRLLGALADLGLADDTLVVFTSDNGGLGTQTSMAPLRGSKGMFYEGGVRVPLVVRWPGRVWVGEVTEVPVIGVDFYPTLASLCGAALPEGQPFDGVDLSPILLVDRAPASLLPARDALFWHFPAYLEAPRAMGIGPWRSTPVGVVRAGDLKLIETFETGGLELYDLADDPGETHDLAQAEPRLTSTLLARMRAWREELGAPMPVAAAAAARER